VLIKNALQKNGAILTAACLFGALAVSHAGAQTLASRYSFTGNADGSNPVSGLVEDSAGNFYGTTAAGGAQSSGTVFKLDPLGNLTVIYSFTGNSDGASPFAGLVMDGSGNLYGANRFGGDDSSGVIFKVNPSSPGTIAVLHTFTGLSDGGYPYGTLILSGGNLYGTTLSGGTGSGVVFEMDLSGNETVLYNFSGGSNGANPYAGVVMDASHNLYGTTAYGGLGNHGVVYELNTTTHQYTVLYSFQGGADGQTPAGSLVLDASGNLFGTTWAYGSGNGTVFKVVPGTSSETVLHTFTGAADGANPYAGLVMDASGTLYGTTQFGGAYLSGTVFKITASGALTVLYNFLDGSDGGGPSAPVLVDSLGNLFGTTTYGGVYGSGTVYKLTLAVLKNVTVSAGESLYFSGDTIGGNVTIAGGTVYLSSTKVDGNVSMNSGNLYVTAGTTVKGNLQVTGGMLNMVPGATINGNLLFQYVAGSTQSQICGAIVNGNVSLQNSTAPVLIGDGLGCSGNNVSGNLLIQMDNGAVLIVNNVVSGNLLVQDNTGAVHVTNNSVTKILQCSGNTSITGSGNIAPKKQQQCSAF
jgi:uncharacterized repeat protein (TIGR03803 family)